MKRVYKLQKALNASETKMLCPECYNRVYIYDSEDEIIIECLHCGERMLKIGD